MSEKQPTEAVQVAAPPKPLRALFVEDSEADVKLILLELQNAGYAVTHQRVQTPADLVSALHNSPWNVVICDHTMPKFDAFAALNLVKRSGLDIPFIIVSGTIGEDLAVMAMKAGAHDYIMKHNLTRLAPAIERELREAQVRQARRRAEEEVQKSLERLRRSMTETIQTMALMAEMRDPYTAGHQRRVADLACAIARELNLGPDKIEAIRMAALVHDIGKIRVPAEILTMPGQLSHQEMGLIRTHPEIAYNILKDVDFPWPVAQIVVQHHERMDGSGYPASLSGQAILLEARILAVADVVEAMSAHRPYRPALGIEKACLEILRNKGTLYDPEVAEVCVRLIMEKNFKFSP